MTVRACLRDYSSRSLRLLQNADRGLLITGTVTPLDSNTYALLLLCGCRNWCRELVSDYFRRSWFRHAALDGISAEQGCQRQGAQGFKEPKAPKEPKETKAKRGGANSSGGGGKKSKKEMGMAVAVTPVEDDLDEVDLAARLIPLKAQPLLLFIRGRPTCASG